jgi:hypothetical protein
MSGINKYMYKDRRRQRLRNHVARDLHKSKYHQRVIPNKKKHREDYDDYTDTTDTDTQSWV